MENSSRYKLLIIEPWNAYAKLNVELIESKDDKFLFKITDSIFFKENKINFLIGILRDNDQYDSFIEAKKEKYLFNLFYGELINTDSLSNMDELKFRGNFFIGEIDL